MFAWVLAEGLRVPLSSDKRHAQPEEMIKKWKKKRFPDYALSPRDRLITSRWDATFQENMCTQHLENLRTVVSAELHRTKLHSAKLHRFLHWYPDPVL